MGEPDPVSRTPDLRRGALGRGVLDARSQAAGVPPQGGGAGASAEEADRRDRPRPGYRGVVPAAVGEARRPRLRPGQGASTDERAELVRLRRGNWVQAWEIEIL